MQIATSSPKFLQFGFAFFFSLGCDDETEMQLAYGSLSDPPLRYNVFLLHQEVLKCCLFYLFLPPTSSPSSIHYSKSHFYFSFLTLYQCFCNYHRNDCNQNKSYSTSSSNKISGYTYPEYTHNTAVKPSLHTSHLLKAKTRIS